MLVGRFKSCGQYLEPTFYCLHHETYKKRVLNIDTFLGVTAHSNRLVSVRCPQWECCTARDWWDGSENKQRNKVKDTKFKWYLSTYFIVLSIEWAIVCGGGAVLSVCLELEWQLVCGMCTSALHCVCVTPCRIDVRHSWRQTAVPERNGRFHQPKC